jgi:hypothetical protein
MRTSRDVFNVHGVLLHGFDYENQAWVENGKYLRCGHPDPMDCGCFGRLHEGESVTPRVVSIDVLKFPHGISCPDCRAANRCNQCGKSATRRDRCTNGRCPGCCLIHCKHMEQV